MRGLFSKRRYELLVLGIVAVFAVIHVATSLRPPEGLEQISDTKDEPSIVVRTVAQVEGRFTDAKFKVRGERPANPGVVVLALDERGVGRWGLWPWPRSVLAQAVERLLDADARAIGFDVAFSDKSNDPALASRRVLEKLEAVADLPPAAAALRDELRATVPPDPDEALRKALTRGGGRIVQGVIAYPEGDLPNFSAETVQQHLAALDARVLRTRRMPSGTEVLLPDDLKLVSQHAVQTPFPAFDVPENSLGHFNMVTDVDGIVRRAAVLMKLKGARGLIPSMSLQSAAVALGARVEPGWDPTGVSGANLRCADGTTVHVPFQGNASYAYINYPGTARSHRTISVVDLVDGKVPKEELAGKVVLVGLTVVGNTGDQRVSPFKYEPGVYTHASMVSNILSGDFLTRSAGMPVGEIAGMLLVGLLFAVLVPRLKSFAWKGAVIVAVIGAWLALDYLLFSHGVLMATVVPLASNVLSAIGVIFLGYLSVDREKLKMRSTFTRYLGEDVMEAALLDPERLNRGEKREMTVLFSDIRGFTSLSERMTPEGLASFINEYLSPMTQIVFDEKGTLDKYIGDAVMAFWNAPLDQPDHAVRACRAAVEMLRKLDELKAGWRAKGLPELEIGVGVNTGPMVVGNMGSDVRVDYTVLGDAVNLGSRLEGTNKEYETRIIISETTWAQAKDAVVSRRLGAVRVKGKRQPVGIFELRGLGKAEGAEAEAVAAFEQGLAAWYARRFDEAQAHFEKVLSLWPGDYPARRYLAELEGFKARPPPPDWDGVASLTTK